ncbi:unnamed protein product [Lota lota]
MGPRASFKLQSNTFPMDLHWSPVVGGDHTQNGLFSDSLGDQPSGLGDQPSGLGDQPSGLRYPWDASPLDRSVNVGVPQERLPGRRLALDVAKTSL